VFLENFTASSHGQTTVRECGDVESKRKELKQPVHGAAMMHKAYDKTEVQGQARYSSQLTPMIFTPRL